MGSGVRNLFKYSQFYSGREPEFIEGDIFRIIVPLDNHYSFEVEGVQNETRYTTQSATQYTTQSIEEEMISLIQREPALSQRQIADRMNMNLNTVKYYIRKLQEQGRLERVGTNRKGHWIVKIKK